MLNRPSKNVLFTARIRRDFIYSFVYLFFVLLIFVLRSETCDFLCFFNFFSLPFIYYYFYFKCLCFVWLIYFLFLLLYWEVMLLYSKFADFLIISPLILTWGNHLHSWCLSDVWTCMLVSLGITRVQTLVQMALSLKIKTSGRPARTQSRRRCRSDQRRIWGFDFVFKLTGS